MAHMTSLPTSDHMPDPSAPSPDPADIDALRAGHIRSFVHRRSHITPSQQAAIDLLMPKWSVSYQPGLLDTTQAFGRSAPLILEIGFGMGETTAKIAAARPNDNFLGVEVFNAGVGAMLKRIDETGLQNIRIIQHDAVEVVRDMIAPDSLAGVHIYFPDPWPKKRHHKKRLFQEPFLKIADSILKPGGIFYVKTDNDGYAEWMRDVLKQTDIFDVVMETADLWNERPDHFLASFQTKFEKIFIGQGTKIKAFELRSRKEIK